MKKTMTTLFMVLALFCAMTTTAFADDTATITIDNTITETGIDLNGKSFEVYQIFSATVENSADPDVSGVISYTIVEAYKGFFTTTVPSMSEFVEIDAEAYIGNLDAAGMQTFAAELATYIDTQGITETSTISGTVHSTDSGNYQYMTSGDLDPGYYLVLDVTDYSSSSANSAGMLITIPEQDSYDNYTQNGTITLKGSQPSIDKEIWHNDLNTTGGWDNVGDYEIGDTVQFRITATVPQDVNGYDDYIYKITDTWSEGLEFKTDSIQIYLDAELNNPATHSLHESEITEVDNTFTLTFDMLDIIEDYPGTQVFYIYYEATITDDVEMALNYETNTVKLEYSNNPYDSSSFGYDEDIVYSYTFQFDVTKTNTGGNVLADAEFGLWVSTPDATTSEYQVYLLQDDLDDNVYYVQQTGTVTEDTGFITTDDTGKFTIKGLDDSLTYILRETEAPEGYTAAEDLSFTITATYNANNIPTITTNRSRISVGSDGVLSTTVINTSSELFPGTGGMGTTMFMIAGCTLMAAAAFMLISNRKRHN